MTKEFSEKDLKNLSLSQLYELKRELEYDIVKYNNLQLAKKVSLNSLYGVLALKQFRFFDSRMAEAITMQGQLSNRWVEDKINALFNKQLNTESDYVIYMDTDSIFISLSALIDKMCPKNYSDIEILKFITKLTSNKLQSKVDEFCLELGNYVNAYVNSLSYKLEKICSTGIFIAKKRYALNVYSNEGVIYAEPKIKVTGLEIVKSSTPSIVRSALKDCIKIIMNSEDDKLKDYVSDFRQQFNSYDIEDISFPRGVNGLYKYMDSVSIYKKSTPIHVRGSILYNKLLVDNKLDSEYELIKDGDKIKFCYLKVPNSIKENVIAFPEKLPKQLDLNQFIDYNYMFSKVFLEPLSSITEKIGWELEKRNSLEDFF